LLSGLTDGQRHFLLPINCDCWHVCLFTTMTSVKDDVTFKNPWKLSFNSVVAAGPWILHVTSKITSFFSFLCRWERWVVEVSLLLCYLMLYDRVKNYTIVKIQVLWILPADCIWVSVSKDYWKSSLSTVFIILKIPRIEKEQWETLSLHRGSGVHGSKDTRCTVQIFSPQCHHMSLIDFVVSPPSYGRNVTFFWGWDAHEEQLRCPDEVDGDIWIWSTRRGLNLILLNYPDHGHNGNLPLQEKNPHGRCGNRPGTSWSVVGNSDH
jgi:hypothetical protein